MHNHWNPAPCPPPSRPEDGDPIVGKIINGKTYPYGCVTTAAYTADKAVLDNKISEIEEQLSTVCNVRIQENEPDINNCIWFKPYSIDPTVLEARLNMNNDPSRSEILSRIDGTDYGVDNATTSEDIPEGVYNFTIF